MQIGVQIIEGEDIYGLNLGITNEDQQHPVTELYEKIQGLDGKLEMEALADKTFRWKAAVLVRCRMLRFAGPARA